MSDARWITCVRGIVVNVAGKIKGAQPFPLCDPGYGWLGTSCVVLRGRGRGVVAWMGEGRKWIVGLLRVKVWTLTNVLRVRVGMLLACVPCISWQVSRPRPGGKRPSLGW